MGAKNTSRSLPKSPSGKDFRPDATLKVFEAAFIQVARETLDQEVFSSLVEAAQLRLG